MQFRSILRRMASRHSLRVAVTFGMLSVSSWVHAQLTVYGGPTFNIMTGEGPLTPTLPTNPGSTAGNGVGVGYGTDLFGIHVRAYRWDASGNPAVELANLGVPAIANAYATAFAVNATGTAVGTSVKYSGDTYFGGVAVRWDASGTAATELDTLFGNSSQAYAINSAGTAVGYSQSTPFAYRAVRWDAGGTVVTGLEEPVIPAIRNAYSVAYAINSSGVSVGQADTYPDTVTPILRATRWDSAGNLTILDDIPGFIFAPQADHANAVEINDAGTAVGYMQTNSPTKSGYRAVRWDANSSAATELGHLGTSAAGFTDSRAVAINSAGTTIGSAIKFLGAGGPHHAVRWDASSTIATELPSLTSDPYSSIANAINSSGIIVGEIFSGSIDVAVLWNNDSVIDLNTLIDPASGWTLLRAVDISDTNWVTGIGRFDPDLSDGFGGYERMFLLNVSSVVPEPGTLSVLALSAFGLMRRRSRRAGAGR